MLTRFVIFLMNEMLDLPSIEVVRTYTELRQNGDYRISIRGSKRGTGALVYLALIVAAKRDFPEVELKDMDIFTFIDGPHSGDVTIEMNVRTWLQVPAGYALVGRLGHAI